MQIHATIWAFLSTSLSFAAAEAYASEDLEVTYAGGQRCALRCDSGVTCHSCPDVMDYPGYGALSFSNCISIEEYHGCVKCVLY